MQAAVTTIRMAPPRIVHNHRWRPWPQTVLQIQIPIPSPHLAACSLQNGIKATFGRVQVAGHILAPHLPLEGFSIPSQGQHVMKAEGWLALLQPGGTGVAKLGGHCTHEGQHCFVHEGAKAWEREGRKAVPEVAGQPQQQGLLLRTRKGGVHGRWRLGVIQEEVMGARCS